MQKPSRWAQWVITDSADPRIPLAWVLTRRRKARNVLAEMA